LIHFTLCFCLFEKSDYLLTMQGSNSHVEDLLFNSESQPLLSNAYLFSLLIPKTKLFIIVTILKKIYANKH